MSFTPTSDESMKELYSLSRRAAGRGDESLSVLVSGIELYIRLGREFELLEIMKKFAADMKEPVEQTPTAAELERLYKREAPPHQHRSS